MRLRAAQYGFVVVGAYLAVRRAVRAAEVLVLEVARAYGGYELLRSVDELFLVLDYSVAAVAVEGVIFLAFLYYLVTEYNLAAEVAHYRTGVGHVEADSVSEVALPVVPVDLCLPTVGVHRADVLGR